MQYVANLNGIYSEMLETLSRRRQLQPSELIEMLVVGHLDSEALKFEGSALRDKTNPAPDSESLSSIKDLYEWDEKNAAILFIPTDERVLIMNAHSWNAIEQDILVRFHRRSTSLLTSMGAAYGRAAAFDFRSITRNPEDLKPYFVHLGLIAGWGTFSISGDLVKGSEITVKVENCIFCGSREPGAALKTPCYFIMGACKGIADAVFDSSHHVEEIKCRARGDRFCEILITL